MRIRLEEFRTKRKLNQRQLSQSSGVPQPMISQIETGDVGNPTIKTLQKLAIALKCTVDDLIEEDAADRRKGSGTQDPETGEPA